MTPPDHDQPLDDERLDDDTLAVNAVVDDEATPEQRRQVARDPELVARVAALREVVAAVAAPIDRPAPDVLAAIRQRALDAATEIESGTDDDDHVDLEVPAPPAPAPVRDLAAARARRTRSLPPLPAVAAVVVLLVLVGVGFLLAAGGKGSQDAATGGVAAESAGGDGGGSGSDDAGGGEQGAAAEGSNELGEQLDEDASASTTTEGQLDGPSGAVIEDLRQRATASYATQADLLAELGAIDPEALALEGTATEASPSTTAPESPTGREDSARLSAELAADPVAQRCDDTLRAGEPGLEAATGAALVEVDGVPVLVLRTPIEASDRAPLGIRLTALTALDCSPLGAVVR